MSVKILQTAHSCQHCSVLRACALLLPALPCPMSFVVTCPHFKKYRCTQCVIDQYLMLNNSFLSTLWVPSLIPKRKYTYKIYLKGNILKWTSVHTVPSTLKFWSTFFNSHWYFCQFAGFLLCFCCQKHGTVWLMKFLCPC